MKHQISILVLLILASSAYSQEKRTISIEGFKRDYRLFVPGNLNTEAPVPLLFVLHGFSQTTRRIMKTSEFNTLADENGFIVVYPKGLGRSWNSNVCISGGSKADDAAFIENIARALMEEYRIDNKRIYACGFSAGGYMSYYLACNSKIQFAGIACVGGLMSYTAYYSCRSPQTQAVMHIHGTSDNIVRYSGGGEGVGVDELMFFWGNELGCQILSDSTQMPDLDARDNSTVVRYNYRDTAGVNRLAHLKVIGGGHQWPGGKGGLLDGIGATNRDISASREIWDFLRNFEAP